MAESTTFAPQAGDTVKTIYPGSPEMLVASVAGDDVCCFWHDGLGHLHEHHYKAAQLKPAREAPKGKVEKDVKAVEK